MQLRNSQRPGNDDRERKVQSTCFARFWLLPSKGYWVSLGIGRSVKTPIRLPLLALPSVIMRHWETEEQGSMLPSHRACHSFTQAHHRFSKAQQKMCSLREQRTRAPSILTLSWRIPDGPPRWKIVCESRRQDSCPRRWRIQSGARDEAWSLRAFV